MVAGVDTVSTISLNGRPILTTDNMFRTYRVNIANKIVSGQNTLSVAFTSPVAYAQAQHDAYPNITTHDFPYVEFQNGFPHVNFIRKEPSR